MRCLATSTGLRAAAIALATCFAFQAPARAFAQAAALLGCDLEPGPLRAVAAVIDGETVRLDDGKEVRLLGVLAPHSDDVLPQKSDPRASAWLPEVEARTALQKLAEGRSVALAFDRLRSDRYGRVLAHLFVSDDAGHEVWIQGRLLEEGQGRVFALPGGEACLPALLARERAARSAGRGLWANAAYQIRPADRPSELALYRNTFQIVRGRVERVGGGRSVGILDLTSGERAPHPESGRQRGAFRVVLPRANLHGGRLGRLGDLVGANILVRGWIDTRLGPEVTVVSPDEIEREDGVAAAAEHEKSPR